MKKSILCNKFKILKGRDNNCTNEFIVESGEDLLKKLLEHVEFGAAHKNDRDNRVIRDLSEFDIGGAREVFENEASEVKNN